ncbi:hypothetical protein MTR67_032345 [Solanum verrucosum]|uniref:Cell differentiation protein rcd1 n=1 Tax=Solanum verrucosum TaxID=315347 RepID=A0AAF0ZHT0_SOLVR|nr:hypothetical protein MTR67_032345 [Solanum verrucosum]
MENLPESPFSESTLGSSSPSPSQKNPNDLGALTPNQLVLLIHDASLREEVMHHLYEKKDSCKNLALLLWNNFNTVYMLLLEVTSVYSKFSPSMLSMKEATRVCCALALFQLGSRSGSSSPGSEFKSRLRIMYRFGIRSSVRSRDRIPNQSPRSCPGLSVGSGSRSGVELRSSVACRVRIPNRLLGSCLNLDVEVLANNPETRRGLIKAKIPCYFYPFLKPFGDDEHLEHVRITTLGVLGDLTKFDDPNGSHALHFFLESEVVPLCLKCMDVCDEMSRKVATLIVMNILTQERGLTYCCATRERFFAIVQVLRRVVEKLSPKPCLLHLEYVIQCYVCLSKIFRSIGPCDAFVRQIPPQLFDNTFRRTLLHDHEASWMLQVLHLNIYGCLYFPPIEERKKIAKKAASSSASSSKGKGKGKK